MKVLFLYPNHKGMTMLPPGVALLSACLKNNGHQVRLFDTTSYNSVTLGGVEDTIDADETKSDRLNVRPAPSHPKVQLNYGNVFDDFRKEVVGYSPDLIALSTTEDMFHLGIELLRKVDDLNILTIAGGVFPTFAPKRVLSFSQIDIVCKGEGEVALTELCQRLSAGTDYTDINNLCFRNRDGSITINPTKMVNMDANPLIDVGLFEEARFYRPMGGTVYRMFPVETHRGCPYKCAFCNSPSQMKMYKEEQGQSYLRRKSFEKMREELLFYKNVMKAEFLYFWADTFFSWTKSDLATFTELYKEIDLPFWCQTRPETITKDRVEQLIRMGCERMSLGVEHGNVEFRRNVLERKMSNQKVIDGLKILSDMGLRFSVNNIMGFPGETRELAFDTIRLNKEFSATDRNCYPFTPFHGTPLRAKCEVLGLVTKEAIVQSFSVHGSVLDMPQFPRSEVNGLCKTFNLYVNFPESRWPEIEKAEIETKEGRKIFEQLRDEFVDRFWNHAGPSADLNPL
jgi:anaerobic magnesium-protoporphyrin IX monomethyl ester cyclase